MPASKKPVGANEYDAKLAKIILRLNAVWLVISLAGTLLFRFIAQETVMKTWLWTHFALPIGVATALLFFGSIIYYGTRSVGEYNGQRTLGAQVRFVGLRVVRDFILPAALVTLLLFAVVFLVLKIRS